MSAHIHERARELLSGGSQIASAEQKWLQDHLANCASCREYSDEIGQVVRALRALPFTAKPALVRSTQVRVRERARELRMRRERLWLLWISCGFVTVFALCSSALLWRGFAWIGKWAEVPDPVWQLGFAMFWIAPTIAASFLFLAHGTHLADRNGGR
jgi:predicted anti-sigma-YlaC factor YlaD